MMALITLAGLSREVLFLEGERAAIEHAEPDTGARTIASNLRLEWLTQHRDDLLRDIRERMARG
ncbi:MAG: hypothetical protein KGL39_22710 [Patescibacteria group bacterium]|nr:hypothetical protein [Patescibacteria group bacterium]